MLQGEPDKPNTLVTLVRILAPDETPVAGTLFEPGPESPSLPISVVIASATGVRRRYYDAFAHCLAGSGFRVVTFDYRGVGDSCPPNLRGYRACAKQWSEDVEAVIDWTARRYPKNELSVIGHSIGGILIGTVLNLNLISRIVLVGSQSGYWRLYRTPQKQGWALLWYVVAPVLTWLFGYFPGRILGLGENLPAGVVREFGRWCRHPSYIAGWRPLEVQQQFSRLRVPVLAYSIDDDTTAPLPAVEALLTFYHNARIERRHVMPAEVGANHLGHFGFFRRGPSRALWVETIEWLKQH